MPVLLTLLLILGLPQIANSETSFEGWYQVDVILFKPRSTDLDDESWPERTPEYPADILAIYPGEPFNLSQLEQALDTEALPPETEQAPALGNSEFAFKNLSSSSRNRRVVEAAIGASPNTKATEATEATDANGTTEANGATGDTENPGAQASTIDGAQAVGIDNTTISDLVRNASQNTHGQLAFTTAESSSLEAIRRSLGRSSRFDVVDHQSWIQPINAEPTPVMVQAGKRYDDRFEIEGTLSFSRSRFLHVQTDLWYTLFEPRGGSRNPYIQGFETSLSDEQLEDYQALVDVERERGQYYAARSHVMTQSRRLRSDELHYIDHPLFGMIVRINRYSPED